MIVAENPTSVVWEGGVLSNEEGPSVSWGDRTALWTIDGIPVDEQIVMCPETQTIEQINQEGNADVQSIRIQRFGWTRYIDQTDSKLVDFNDNDIEGTKEALYQTKLGKRLVTTCPTGRVFAMGVVDEVENCRQAQNYLAGRPLDSKSNVLLRT